MLATLFVSYRRGSDSGYCQAVYDRLKKRFGEARVFMDVATGISAGLDIGTTIEKKVDASTIVLMLIGPQWMQIYNSRVDDEVDWVRFELLTALAQKKHIIPILINDAAFPRPPEWPEALYPIASLSAVHLTSLRFDEDFNQLVSQIDLIYRHMRDERRLPANWTTLALTAGACFVLAALFAGMAHMLAGDANATRAVPMVLVGIAFVLSWGGFLSLRRSIDLRRQRN